MEEEKTEEKKEFVMPKNPYLAIVKSASIPLVLSKTAQKYNISISEALKEGIYLLLQQKDEFKDSNDNYEVFLREKGIYKQKIRILTNALNKAYGGSDDVKKND